MTLILLDSRRDAAKWLQLSEDLSQDILAMAETSPNDQLRKELNELVEFFGVVGAGNEQLRLARAAYDLARRGIPIPIDTAIQLTDLVNVGQGELRKYLQATAIETGATTGDFRELLDSMGDTLPRLDARLAPVRRQRLVRRVIYDSPGVYVRQLFRALWKKHDYGFTYDTLLNDLEALVHKREILTIGGPRGHLKFCFPEPSRVRRSAYFGKQFGVEALVQERIDDPGEVQWRSGFFDFYKVNGLTEATLVAVRYQSVDLERGQKVRTFGLLEPLGIASKMIGITKLSTQMDTRSMIIARKVAAVDDDSEVELFYDPNPLRPGLARPRMARLQSNT